MAVTLQTPLDTLMFSSSFPDLALSTSDNNEAEIILRSPDYEIFSAVHFPYNRGIVIHDLRSVIEMYMRDRNLTLDEFELLAVHNGSQQILATFKIVYLEHSFSGDIAEFLRNNFLTTQSAKLTTPTATEFLNFYIAAGDQEKLRYQVVASVGDGEPRAYQLAANLGSSNADRIYHVEITYEIMLGIVENPAQGRPRENITVHAYSIHAGNRAFTFYVQHDPPEVMFYFRNAFNCYECCALHAVTTHKPKVDRSIAVTNRLSTFYNQQNEKQYEVETTGLTLQAARWLEQLFYAHDVRLATKREDFTEETVGSYRPDKMPVVLITDFTCEIHDRDGELNTVKFTYQYSDRRPLLPTDYLSVDHERIFTNPYNPTFN